MRPLLCALAVLAAGVATGVVAPGGGATTSAPGDGCLVVNGGFGNISIYLTQGVVFGRVQSANSITTDDTVVGDGPPPKVFGADTRKVLPDGRIRYTSQNSMRFRSSGAVRIRINDATLIDLSVVGKGYAYLSAGTFDVPGNTYSADAASFCQDNFLPLPQLPAPPAKAVISSPDS
jgi:hypothetical protein